MVVLQAKKRHVFRLNATGRQRANSESARTLKILTRQTRTRLLTLPVGRETPTPVQQQHNT